MVQFHLLVSASSYLKIVLPIFETNVNLTEDEKVIYKFLSKTMLPALFEPDKDQIPQIMERIFLQYYKLYNKSNSVNFIPKYDYIPMTKGNGIKEDKTGED